MTPEADVPADEDRDPMIVRLDGPTPAGGAYALMTYLDDAGAGVPKSRATRIRIEEFDGDGVVLASTVGNV
jgi:hypothetical protein